MPNECTAWHVQRERTMLKQVTWREDSAEGGDWNFVFSLKSTETL